MCAYPPDAGTGETQSDVVEDVLRALRINGLDTGVNWASRRLAVCDTIKSFERSGKSRVIDSFTRHGLPLGAHRAGDALHDPVCGFFLAVREMGITEACVKWAPHMVSDVMTARSLPLPGTFLLKNESWVVQMYAKGLLNLRTGVVTPCLGAALTDFEVRMRFRAGDLEGERNLVLQEAHLKAGTISATATLLLLLLPHISPALLVSFGASAVWYILAAGVYCVKRNRQVIRVRLRTARAQAGNLVRGTRMRLGERPESSPRVRGPSNDSAASEDGTTSMATSPSSVALGIAAAAMVVVLLFGPK